MSLGTSALRKFFLVHLPDGGPRQAYLRLNSSEGLREIARHLSDLFGISFSKGQDFDECEAFVGYCDSYDITLLQPATLQERKGGYELMIEAGHLCEDSGSPTDLTAPLCAWLKGAGLDFEAAPL